jgi:hypothetical protein
MEVNMQRSIQMDVKMRVVALSNLRAICEHESTTTKHYSVDSVSDKRVKVSFNNPDEYGIDFPFVAEFPCYPFPHFGTDDIAIVLDAIRIYRSGHTSDLWKDYEHILFEPIIDAPKLVRRPDGEWVELYSELDPVGQEAVA